jgi:hypothetical protein
MFKDFFEIYDAYPQRRCIWMLYTDVADQETKTMIERNHSRGEEQYIYSMMSILGVPNLFSFFPIFIVHMNNYAV